MASEPTTPVKVPKAASTYGMSIQDPDLRSQINTVLLREGHVAKIQEALLHALHASPTNWPTLIQKHALALLRSGDCTTFPALMSRVMEDVRSDTVEARAGTGSAGAEEKGANGVNAGGKAGLGDGSAGGSGGGHGEGGASLALPKSVVEEGVRITRECLETVCEVE